MTLAKFGKWPEGEIGAQILREGRERVRKGERKGERERRKEDRAKSGAV
jgi:hypothetical protein